MGRNQRDNDEEPRGVQTSPQKKRTPKETKGVPLHRESLKKAWRRRNVCSLQPGEVSIRVSKEVLNDTAEAQKASGKDREVNRHFSKADRRWQPVTHPTAEEVSYLTAVIKA